jgi:cbb3-type cytochrome oxidase maturation protein
VDILLLLIPLSALIVLGAIVVYLRAVDTGQFDDLERQGRITLFEEITEPTPASQRRDERTKSG